MLRSRQSGYTLLVVMLGLLSLGGFVIAEFTENARAEVRQQKSLHNQRVLAEAKEALLQFAFNYPQTDGNGPGHLPCADTDNNGQPNTAFGTCVSIGRLPWADPNLNLYDIRDADGQRLWYMVSNNFATNASPEVPINGASTGAITLRDQTGAILFDGSANDGVAAVIIAPGAAIERNGVMQDRQPANADDPFDTVVDTDPAILDADRYLDLVNGVEDNSDVAETTLNGFIVGPVETAGGGTILLNDQVAFITVADLIETAEKATLRAYRDALTAYDARIDADLAVADDYYPWLYNYTVFEEGSGIGQEIDEFPAESPFANEIANRLQNWGRVPSMFARYYVDTDSETIESEIRLEVVLDDPADPPGRRVGFVPDFEDDCPESDIGFVTCGPLNTVFLDFDGIGDIGTNLRTYNFNSAGPLTNVRFSSAGLVLPGADSSLNSDAPGAINWNQDIYLWDEQAGEDGWRLCRDLGPGDGDTDDGTSFVDCEQERNAQGTNIQVLRVTISMPLLAAGNPMQIELDYGALGVGDVEVISAADNNGHARIRAEFPVAGTSLPLTMSYQYDDNFSNIGSWDVDQSGQINVVDLTPTLRLTMRYYPELPAWVKTEGWYQNVMFAYAPDYLPNVAGDCNVGTDCLQLNNTAGLTKNDKISVLVFGGPDVWDDQDDNNLSDDLVDVFDDENRNSFAAETAEADIVFNAFSPGGNDRAIAVCERTAAGGSRCF